MYRALPPSSQIRISLEAYAWILQEGGESEGRGEGKRGGEGRRGTGEEKRHTTSSQRLMFIGRIFPLLFSVLFFPKNTEVDMMIW